MRENISPEEKLLDIIKKGANNTKNTPPEQAEQEAPAEPAPKASLPKKIDIKSAKTFSILNKFLILAGMCTAAYMIISYIYPYTPKSGILERVEPEKGGELLAGTPKAPPPASYYTDILSRRQMFKLYEVPKPKPSGPPKPKVTIQQLLAGYTFIGVIFGDVPQAIVEEKRTGQSFYLTAGQFLGEIKIEKIERGRITVSYEDESMVISI